MPIQRDWTDPSGAQHTVSYWVVELIAFDFKLLRRNVRINGYHNSTTFAAGATRLTYIDYQIDGAPNYSLTLQQALDGLYSYILATDPFFSGGTLV